MSQIIPDTNSPKVAMTAAALHIANRSVEDTVHKNDECIELLKKFTKAYEMIDAVVERNFTTEQINQVLERIKGEF